MSESSEVKGGGTIAARSIDASAVVSLGGRMRCDTGRLNPRAFRACSYLSSPLPKKGGIDRSNDMNGLKCRKLL